MIYIAKLRGQGTGPGMDCPGSELRSPVCLGWPSSRWKILRSQPARPGSPYCYSLEGILKFKIK